MFDDFYEHPPPEYRLSRIVNDSLQGVDWPGLTGAITAAEGKLATYRKERDAHKYGGGPLPRLSLLSDALMWICEAAAQIRAQRAADGDQAIARQHGIEIATVIDELWQSSDAIWCWIEYERTRWYAETHRIRNPATGEEIEVDCTDPEAMRRAMAQLVETPEQWLVRGVRRRLRGLVTRVRGWINHARP